MTQLHGIEMMWDIDYWVGPLTGIVQHRGQVCYFSMWEENQDDSTWHRRYLVHELSEEEIQHEYQKHLEPELGLRSGNYRTNRVLGWFAL